MHTLSSRLALATLLGATALPAQNFMGFSYNTIASTNSRGQLDVAAGEIMTRIDGDEYAGWGTDNPGMRTIASIFLLVQDQDAVATPNEPFGVYLYPEDPTNPGFPDLAQRTPFVVGLAGPGAPPSGTINGAVIVATPAAPVAVPIQGGGDVFVALDLPAAPNWPNDGLSTLVILGYQPAGVTFFDSPGQAQQTGTPPGPENSHMLTNLAGALTYDERSQFVFDIAHSTAAGVALGITNQASFPASANPPPTGFGPAPGTASFFSGTAPDVSQFDPARADDVSFDYFRAGSGPNPLVFFLVDIGGFAPEVPLANFVPGSTGVLCLSNNAITLGIGASVGDEAWFTQTFPAGARASAVGLPMVQQAVEFDPNAVVGHASPCARQVF